MVGTSTLSAAMPAYDNTAMMVSLNEFLKALEVDRSEDTLPNVCFRASTSCVTVCVAGASEGCAGAKEGKAVDGGADGASDGLTVGLNDGAGDGLTV